MLKFLARYEMITMTLSYGLQLKLVSYMIFSFFKTKRSWCQNIQEFLHLKCSAPFIFLIRFLNRMLDPLIFLIRFSDQIKPSFSVYKLAF